MKLGEFLRTKTNVGDLIMFHRDGWYVGCTIIDHEDLFAGSLNSRMLDGCEVRDHYYTSLDWTTKPVMIVNI